MIHAVLFDMDGTIFDTEKIYRECWTGAATEVCPDIDIREDIPQFSGMIRSSIEQYFFQKYGTSFPFQALSERRLSLIDELLTKGIPLKPGIPDVFDELHRIDVAVALVSSTENGRIHRYLSETGLTDRFDLILGSNDVAHGKPSPEPYLTAAERLGLPPQECVVAEDSASGVRSGFAAGMKVVMVPDLQPCTPELRRMLWHCADSLKTLPALIAAENE